MSAEKIKIRELESLAEAIKSKKSKVRPNRPIVIEVCGTPKSGKTTWVNSLNTFLKRNGFTTKILSERASVCPISDKFNPSFNLWNFFSSTAELLEHHSECKGTIDVIILDRGVFDCLCWFYWFYNHKHISYVEFQTFVNFLTIDRISRIIDIVYVFKVDCHTAIKREYTNLLTEKRGSIMNEQVLSEYNDAVDKCIENEKSKFKVLEIVEGTDGDLLSLNRMLTEKVLKALDTNLSEQIGYISRQMLIDRPTTWDFNDEFANLEIQFAPRDEVERNSMYVQPVPVVVLYCKKTKKAFVVRKTSSSTSKTSPEKNKDLLYVGGHIRIEDKIDANTDDFIEIAKTALAREIKEELSVELHIEKYEPFFIYTPDNERSERHFALCHVYECDMHHLKPKLDQDELKSKYGKGGSLRFCDVDKLQGLELEPWSRIILKKVFGTDSNIRVGIFDPEK